MSQLSQTLFGAYSQRSSDGQSLPQLSQESSNQSTSIQRVVPSGVEIRSSCDVAVDKLSTDAVRCHLPSSQSAPWHVTCPTYNSVCSESSTVQRRSQQLKTTTDFSDDASSCGWSFFKSYHHKRPDSLDVKSARISDQDAVAKPATNGEFAQLVETMKILYGNMAKLESLSDLKLTVEQLVEKSEFKSSQQDVMKALSTMSDRLELQSKMLKELLVVTSTPLPTHHITPQMTHHIKTLPAHHITTLPVHRITPSQQLRRRAIEYQTTPQGIRRLQSQGCSKDYSPADQAGTPVVKLPTPLRSHKRLVLANMGRRESRLAVERSDVHLQAISSSYHSSFRLQRKRRLIVTPTKVNTMLYATMCQPSDRPSGKKVSFCPSISGSSSSERRKSARKVEESRDRSDRVRPSHTGDEQRTRQRHKERAHREGSGRKGRKRSKGNSGNSSASGRRRERTDPARGRKLSNLGASDAGRLVTGAAVKGASHEDRSSVGTTTAHRRTHQVRTATRLSVSVLSMSSFSSLFGVE